MTRAHLAAVLKQVAGNQLKDTHTAIKASQKQIASRELEDAMQVLQQRAVLMRISGPQSGKRRRRQASRGAVPDAPPRRLIRHGAARTGSLV